MRRLVSLLATAALIAGCSNRERLNPFDPGNALTGGAPQRFTALAENSAVQLVWLRPSNTVVLGYRLMRRVGTETTFRTLFDLEPNETQYFDVGLLNGVDHIYRLAYVLPGGALSPAAEQVATPGSARPWVVDYSARSLLRLTADGRHVAQQISGPFQSPAAVDVDGATGQVWVCDPYGGRLWRVSPGVAPEEIGSVLQPVAVSIDSARGRIWICDQRLGALQGFDRANPVAPVVDVRGLADPLAVAVDPFDGSAWACERTGDDVLHVNYAGVRSGSASSPQPSRVAVDSVTRRIWVTSFTNRSVHVFGSNGFPADTIPGLGGPVGIAVDSRIGHIWVADAAADRVLVYDRSGNELFHVDGLSQPLEIALDAASGEAWVVASAGGQVARIAADGRVLNRGGGFVQPYDIAIERAR